MSPVGRLHGLRHFKGLMCRGSAEGSVPVLRTFESSSTSVGRCEQWKKNTTTELKLVGNVGRMPPVFFLAKEYDTTYFRVNDQGRDFCIPKFS